MWNCDRIPTTGPRETVEDVEIRFQSGSMSDRIGTENIDIIRLRKAGENLGSLAVYDGLDKSFQFNDSGFVVSGSLVTTAENGFVTGRLGRGETWVFTVVAD
jgi:hypothetical protein